MFCFTTSVQRRITTLKRNYLSTSERLQHSSLSQAKQKKMKCDNLQKEIFSFFQRHFALPACSILRFVFYEYSFSSQNETRSICKPEICEIFSVLLLTSTRYRLRSLPLHLQFVFESKEKQKFNMKRNTRRITLEWNSRISL